MPTRDPATVRRPEVVMTPLADLRPHPRNYRSHPDDQLEHIAQSIRTHGFYRNVVVAKNGVILAGHGVTEAAAKIGMTHVPVVRLDIDPNDPRALKLLAGDNEIGNLAETDDRALTELLKEILEVDDEFGKLLGTGFNEEQLASLAMTTRPASEIADMDEAAHWVGMPEYEQGTYPHKLVVTFKSPEDRARFVAEIGLKVDKKAVKGNTWSTRWPWTDREDAASVKFEDDGMSPPPPPGEPA